MTQVHRPRRRASGRIQVPIPDNPLGHTLVHLLDTDRGPVLVDTGWDDPAVLGHPRRRARRAAALASPTSTAWSSPTTTPTTTGSPARSGRRPGAWIAMHARRRRVVRRTREAEPGAWLDYLAGQARRRRRPRGPPRPAARRPRPAGCAPSPGCAPPSPTARSSPANSSTSPAAGCARSGRPATPPATSASTWRRTTPPGSPGHGRLFSGDHLLPGITPHIGLYEDPDDATVTDPLGDYLDSLERVGRLGPAEVLPAHQHAFTDAAARVRELLDHHEDRLTGLLALLADPAHPLAARRAHGVEPPLADIPYGSRNIAVSEAEAHLRRLVKLGRAEAVPGTDPVTYQAR